jgi:hypothetical protein
MKVYVVHGRKDLYIAQAIADTMNDEGVGVWTDAPGLEAPGLSDFAFEERIYGWMEESDLVVVIWSENSMNSDLVRKQWKIALTTDRRIIAVKVGDVSVPDIPEHVFLLSVGELQDVPYELTRFVKSISRYKIFISYSRKDRRAARQLVRLIHRSPHEVWIDESGIDPGEGFPEKIIQTINNSDYFILLWSRNSKESRWVEREWNHAYKESKKILPLLLDKTPLPMALESINAFTSLEDEKLYRFLTIKRVSNQKNILVKVTSLIKRWLKNAA